MRPFGLFVGTPEAGSRSLWRRWRDAGGWGAFSLVVHALVLVALLAIVKPFAIVPRATPASEGPEVSQLVYLTAVPDMPSRGEQPPPGEGREVSPGAPPVQPAVEGVDRPGPLGLDTAIPAPRITFAVAPRARRRLGPSYGDGRLWVPPIDVLALGRQLPGAAGGGGGRWRGDPGPGGARQHRQRPAPGVPGHHAPGLVRAARGAPLDHRD